MQSNRTRALVALAAVAILVVAFVVLEGGEEAEDGPRTTATPQAEPKPPTGGPSKPADPPASEALPTIVIEDGRPVGGVAELEFSTGEEVRFAVQSDTADEVHVHGYDVMEDVEAGKEVKLDFPADIEGVFEVELEATATPIAELTVTP